MVVFLYRAGGLGAAPRAGALYELIQKPRMKCSPSLANWERFSSFWHKKMGLNETHFQKCMTLPTQNPKMIILRLKIAIYNNPSLANWDRFVSFWHQKMRFDETPPFQKVYHKFVGSFSPKVGQKSTQYQHIFGC